MDNADLESFSAMLDSVSGLISKGRYTPSEEHTAVFFEALRPYPLAAVSAGFTAHVRDPERGKFAPTPADVIAQIEAGRSDGRPGADEAWAMMPMDESQTVVWTTEMAEAFNLASPLLKAGDKVGARMAFREAYERAVAQAKRHGRRAVWEPSLGHDLEQRKRALSQAVEKGLLSATAAQEACPALPLTTEQRRLLPAPTMGGKQAFKAAVSKLAERMTVELADPLAWARRLQAREEAGEDLHISQRDAWRQALFGSAIPEGQLFAHFRAPPDDVLPPGMRKRDPAADMTFDEQEEAVERAEEAALAWEAQP